MSSQLSLKSPKSRHQLILENLKQQINKISGIALEDLAPDANVFEMGMDSLMLTQLQENMEQDLGVTLSLNDLYTEIDTLNKMASYLEPLISAALFQPPAPEPKSQISGSVPTTQPRQNPVLRMTDDRDATAQAAFNPVKPNIPSYSGRPQQAAAGIATQCAPVPNSTLDRLFTLQLETWKHQQQGLASLMSQQMEMLRGNAPASLLPHSSPMVPSFE
ncbi:acyl carrier protein, partial [Deltaproteobacteria bacterium TL4]